MSNQSRGMMTTRRRGEDRRYYGRNDTSIIPWENTDRPRINSFRTLAQAQRRDVDSQGTTQNQRIRQVLNSLTDGNSSMARSELLRFLSDGARNIDLECGYLPWITPEDYRRMYDREGIAKRVVDCEPEETWGMDPEIYEDADAKTKTVFEQAAADLIEEFNIWSELQRADKISGIGQYGIILLGINDGLPLHQPVEQCNPDGTWAEGADYKLLYIRCFSEEVLWVKQRETDRNSPRYGQPIMYQVQFRDYPSWGSSAIEMITSDIHFSRVIHIADNRKMSNIYGEPRMKPVWNRLVDLRKVYAATGESFWKGAFPGLILEVLPEFVEMGAELDADSIRKEVERYMNSTQKYMAVKGVTAKTLPPTVTDPTGTAQTLLQAVAIAISIPYRVLFGTEEAKQAGNQDTRAWNKRLTKRQTKYCTPLIIRPFFDRLINLGILPPPKAKRYSVEWEDLNMPTDLDKAQVGLVRTQALQAYVAGGVDQLVPPDQYFTAIMEMDQDEADAILDSADSYTDEITPPQARLPQDPEAKDGDAPDGDKTQVTKNRGRRRWRYDWENYVENFDDDEARDDDGKWTDGGGSSGSKDTPKPKGKKGSSDALKQPHLDKIASAKTMDDVYDVVHDIKSDTNLSPAASKALMKEAKNKGEDITQAVYDKLAKPAEKSDDDLKHFDLGKPKTTPKAVKDKNGSLKASFMAKLDKATAAKDIVKVSQDAEAAGIKDDEFTSAVSDKLESLIKFTSSDGEIHDVDTTWTKKLTTGERSAFKNWRGVGYVDYRGYEMGQTNVAPYAKKTYDDLQAAIDKSPDYKGEAFRGIAIDDDQYRAILAKPTMSFDATTSFTSELETGEDFADQGTGSRFSPSKPGVQVVLHYKGDRALKDLRALNQAEREIIVRKGFVTKIKSVKTTKLSSASGFHIRADIELE